MLFYPGYIRLYTQKSTFPHIGISYVLNIYHYLFLICKRCHTICVFSDLMMNEVVFSVGLIERPGNNIRRMFSLCILCIFVSVRLNCQFHKQ